MIAYNQMIVKIVILILTCLLFSVHSYSQENGVLILGDEDLDNITSIYPHLFVKYYVPWCRHCQQLAPIFQEIAKDLQSQNSTIRLAKINCQQNQKAYHFQNIRHFPTLVFYNKGQPLNFDGDRTKPFIFKWLTKRLVSPVKQIGRQQLKRLSNSDSEQVSLVFHGQLESVKGATFTNIAYQDNYNNYYFIKDHIKPYGTVEILRSFASNSEYPFPDQSFQYWVSEHDRPSVVPLDDRSISSIFRDGRLAVFLFLSNQYLNKKAEFTNAADYWKNKTDLVKLIFVHVPEQHEDYFGLLQYMDVNPIQTPLFIVNSQLQTKYLLQFNVTQITAQKIINFLHSFHEGKALQTPLESQKAHKHHHDHDHDHQHDHEHDHGHHHHHEDEHQEQHSHDHQHQQGHQHSEDCKHRHRHHHHSHNDGKQDQEKTTSNEKQQTIAEGGQL